MISPVIGLSIDTSVDANTVVNGAIESNVFLSSINAGVNIMLVNVDTKWEWALTIRTSTY